ncbi:hypothetical protein [Parablautia intestinalis]|uniref:hypothetical protein n=1 Tax=Parablautia intestinalis TaxID=2320100 RepID=UPI00256F297D|nr:hypothetical protein [Parablautia intestinalis]
MATEKNKQQIPGQIGLFEFLANNYKAMSEEAVKIEGVINTKILSDYTVQSTYRDIFLIINMLDDYVKMLENAETVKGFYVAYMIEQFKRISGELSRQIELDKEKMYKRCTSRQQNDDIGEDAMILASK